MCIYAQGSYLHAQIIRRVNLVLTTTRFGNFRGNVLLSNEFVYKARFNLRNTIESKRQKCIYINRKQ